MTLKREYEFISQLIKRQISSNVANQTNNPTCWAFAACRVILKFIKSVLPELQTSSTDNTACDKYYNYDNLRIVWRLKIAFFKTKTITRVL